MGLFTRWRKKSDIYYNIPKSEHLKSTSKLILEKNDGLFDQIIGFDDVKELFDLAIKAYRPVHLVLVGPPASAKSLFMSSLTNLERSYYAVGSNSTRSGIFDYLFEYRPRFLIIDEIEKMNKRDQTSLLNLMESGILSELKHKQHRTTQLKTWVFASCNSTDKLLPPLLTRFREIHFKSYTEQEFVEIAVKLLDREERIDNEVAMMIAQAVFNKLNSTNIRDCIRIARLIKNDNEEDVDVSKVYRIIETFVKYAPKTTLGEDKYKAV